MERNSKFLSSLLCLLTTMGLAIVCLIAAPENLKAQSNTFPASGNAGIGTTTPGVSLEITKSQNAVTAASIDNGYTTAGNTAYSGLQLRQNGTTRFHLASINDNNTGAYGGPGAVQLWNFANGPMLFANNGTETMRLTAGGSLGLGTTTPGNFFGGVAGSGRFLHIGNTSDHAQLLLSAMGAGKLAVVSFEVSDAMLGRRVFQTRYDGANNMVKSFFFNEANGVVTQDNVLVLKNTGFVGIGTAGPTRPLEVLAGDGEAMRLYRNGNTVNFGVNVRFALNNSSGAEIDYAGVHGQIASNTAGAEGGNLLFSTATSGTATEKVRITSAGNVGVGTTTPGYRFDVQGGQLNTSGGLCIAGDCKTAWSQVGGSSQWTTSGSNVYYSTGNVGIGIGTPGYRLDVQGGQLNTSGGLCIAGDCKTAWSQVTGSSQWTTSGSNVYYNTGSVGLGIASPAVQFHLVNSSTATARIESSGSAAAGIDFKNPSRRWVFGTGILSGAGDFSIYDANAAATRMYFDTSGKVGIGTSSPGTSLDISGNTMTVGSESGSTGRANNTTKLARVAMPPYTSGNLNFALVGGATTSTANIASIGGEVGGMSAATQIDFLTAASTNVDSGTIRMTVNSAGNVGIGTTSPTTKLDVNGTINATALTVNGNAVGGSQWTTSGSNVYYNTGNVGLGTSDPSLGGLVGSRLTTVSADETATAITTSNGTLPRFGLNNHSNGSWTMYDYAANAWHSGITQLSGSVGIGTTAPTSKLHVVGDGKITGNLTVDGNIAAKYQDLAEWVNSSQALAVGTVVVLDQTRSNQVIASTSSYDTRVAGVISAQPGIALGEGGEGKVLVATTGRVRIKVDASSGPIHIGDLLVTSDVPGVAMKSQPVSIGGVQIHRPGTLIGKALENLETGKGEMLVLLSLQ